MQRRRSLDEQQIEIRAAAFERHCRHERRGLDAGNRVERVDDVVLHAQHTVRVGLDSKRDRELHRLQLGGLGEAWLDREQRLERSQHETRAHE